MPGRLALSADVDEKGYCDRAEDNLVATVGPDSWTSAKADVKAGKGTELQHKFRAAYSSSALAVNAFAPLAHRVELPGKSVEGPVRFEQERSAWTRGFKPTLDVTVEREGQATRLFVESKCIEYLRATDTSFSSAFVDKASDHLSTRSLQAYKGAAADGHAYNPLDARQLLKHFLAAKRTANDNACHVILLCVWWQPNDAGNHSIFAEHADAATRLAHDLKEPDVELLPLSYQQLWANWDSVGDEVLRRHVKALRHRYDVPLDAIS